MMEFLTRLVERPDFGLSLLVFVVMLGIGAYLAVFIVRRVRRNRRASTPASEQARHARPARRR